MAEEFDVVVIGAGPAGEVAAARTAAAGLTTLIVESDLAGGECSYWACMPSKALLRPTEALDAAKRVKGAREAIDGTVDVEAVLELRDAFTSDMDDKYQVQWIEDNDVTFMRGRGRLAGERTISVEHADGTTTDITARRGVIVATGTSAAIPPIDGLRDIDPWDNRDITTAEAVPDSLVVIGGGVVGVEMAQAWKRLGSSEVAIIEMLDRLLPTHEPFAGEELETALAADGIAIHTSEAVQHAERDADGIVHLTTASGLKVSGREVLVAVGRRPNTGDIGADAVGLEPGRYIEVDDRMAATAVPGDWLYAIGDVNGRSLLTHAGKYQAIWAADQLDGRTGPDHEAWADLTAVPSVVFTDPQVTHVGYTVDSARGRGFNVRELTYATGGVAGSALHGEDAVGTSQLVIDDDRGVVIGATFVGRDIAELIHSATIAIVGEVPVKRLVHAIPSFPTVSEVWLRLLEEYEAQLNRERTEP